MGSNWEKKPDFGGNGKKKNLRKWKRRKEIAREKRSKIQMERS